MRYAYLIKVDSKANNNKYYEMCENADGTFTATYGRIERKVGEKNYLIGRWNSIYKSKLRKGYKDHTDYKAIKTNTNDTQNITHESDLVVSIFKELKNAANVSFETNYSSHIGAVTQMMIDDAQALLNNLADLLDAANWHKFNEELVKLFMVIPRRIDGKVADKLVSLTNATQEAKQILGDEQDLLDMVRGQVTTSTQVVKTNLLEALGLKASEVTPTEIATIKQKLGEISSQFHSAIKIEHGRTLDRFNKNNQVMPSDLRLEWHGSRTENWLSILNNGLMLYPTAARITGKMFGYSLYFSPKARKSLGYTSVNNSYWARGTKPYGYLALFNLNMGRILEVNRHKSWHSTLTAEKLNDMGYDSVYAYGGYDLRNDEMMVYTEAQATIGYLVKVSG